MLTQALHVNSGSSYHRLMSTLSWVSDLCNIVGFTFFGPGVLKARGLNNSIDLRGKEPLEGASHLSCQPYPGKLPQGTLCTRKGSFGRLPHCGRN